MKIPFRIRLFRPFRRRPKYIIIHDVNCMYDSYGEVKNDTVRFQTNKFRNYQYRIHMQADINYHFIIEKINDDFEVVLGRPFAVDCIYEDIPDIYRNSLHVAIMGSCDFNIPTDRLYKKIVYNVLAPSKLLFNIPVSRILTHNEISTNKEIDCPGSYFDKALLISHYKSMIISK